MFDCGGYGTPDQVHLADKLDALFRLVVKVEYEAKDIARIDQTNDDDVSRFENRVGKDIHADTRLDELISSVVLEVAVEVRVPGRRSQRPELAVVMFQDL